MVEVVEDIPPSFQPLQNNKTGFSFDLDDFRFKE